MSHHFTSVEFENFGPIQEAKLELTRLHALIGPNDSGKSFTLQALAYAATLNRSPPHKSDSTRVAATKNTFRITQALGRAKWTRAGQPQNSLPAWVGKEWGPSRLLRLDPDDLRQPHALIPEDQKLDFSSERGLGLGAVLDAVISRDPGSRDELQKAFLSLFPTVAAFRFFTRPNGRQVGVRLKSGVEVPPDQMSEGMLYFLAFAVLKYLQPTPLLLIEEPENGLHPSRIADVMRVLRELSATTQVVLATHSPLVVNELQPDEVTVVTRTAAEGTKFTPISQTANFAQRFKTYALGELWLSYADGKDEAPLFKTGSGA